MSETPSAAERVEIERACERIVMHEPPVWVLAIPRW
jgi:hypothetical protein